MSRAYCYIVFAPGKQPTVEEVAQLQQWSTASKNRYAIGIHREDGGLAIAFEAQALDAVNRRGDTLGALLERWQVRGCQLHDRLTFIKQPAALQPVPSSLPPASKGSLSASTAKQKQRAAQEALGRAGLKFQQTLEQHAWLQRVASVVPYALMGLGGLLTIVAGIYFGQRLLQAPAERREQTIRRVASDAMSESLAVQRKPGGAVEATPPAAQ
ncbi:MAG: hypothetical protein ACR2NM_03830 [Bythopirellula sp.]